MTDLTFRNVCNLDNLFKLIDNCIGPIYLQSDASDKIDLRKNLEIKKALAEAYDGDEIESLSVLVANRKDMPQILGYLLSCKRCK